MEKISQPLKKEHTFGDYLYWNLLISVPVLTACIGIARQSILGLLFYLFICLVCLGLVYRFFCTHCPHYEQGEKGIKCMFYWKIPRLFPARPGPLSGSEKTITAAAVVVFAGVPLFWLLTAPGLLLIYLLSLAAFGLTIRRNECGRCVYTDCPSNCVPKTPDNGD